MSKFMLDDKATMDHVNPFVQNKISLPGATRHPGEFAKHKPIENVKKMVNDFKSPICEYGVTVGWGAPNMCTDVQGERCHLSRPILPGRNIDRGYDEDTSTNVKKLILRDSSGELTLTAYMFISLIILLLFLAM